MSSTPDIHCSTFGGGSKHFQAAAHRLARQAVASGLFTAATAVTGPEPLEDEEFRTEHAAFIARNRRGYGYWIRKPYPLHRKLQSVRDGDFVFCYDAGCEVSPLRKHSWLAERMRCSLLRVADPGAVLGHSRFTLGTGTSQPKLAMRICEPRLQQLWNGASK